VDISTGEGAEKSGERGGTKTAMEVGHESSSRQRSEREERVCVEGEVWEERVCVEGEVWEERECVEGEVWVHAIR
jgi:hypothetical protein